MARPRKDRPVFTIDEKVQHKTDEECLRIGSIIRKYRTDMHMEIKQLAELLGYSATAVRSWEIGISRPNIEIMRVLCRVLKIPMNEMLDIDVTEMLSGHDKQMLSDYHALSKINRASVDMLMQNMLAQQYLEEKRRVCDFYRPLFEYEDAAAAGFGIDMEGDEQKSKVYLLRDRVPAHATCVIRVNGDSMEPNYPDGCRVYVDASEKPAFGDVGIFVVDGVSYIKRCEKDGLHSYNPKYKTIRIYETTGFMAFGKVLSIVRDGDFAPEGKLAQIEEAYRDE